MHVRFLKDEVATPNVAMLCAYMRPSVLIRTAGSAADFRPFWPKRARDWTIWRTFGTEFEPDGGTCGAKLAHTNLKEMCFLLREFRKYHACGLAPCR